MSRVHYWKGRLLGGLSRLASGRQNSPECHDVISLVPFDRARDKGLLRKWLSAPHVVRWWGTPDRALEYALDEPVGGGHVLIRVASKPVGYMRWKVPPRHAFDEAGLTDMPEGTIDIDIMIGEEQETDRGIGTAALRLLAGCLAESGAPLLMICSSTANPRAIRAYEKAGFQRIRRFDDPAFGEMWLLTLSLDRQAASS